MKTSSAKAKGRRASQETKDLLLEFLKKWGLEDGDITITSSGCTGRDVCLSPKAKKLLPLAIEAKNCESINIWKAYQQAVSHVLNPDYEFEVPIVFFKRNRSNLMVCLSAEDFMTLVSNFPVP